MSSQMALGAVLTLLIASSASGADRPAPEMTTSLQRDAGVGRTPYAATEVIIIGTIHAQHLMSQRYAPEVLREIILSLRPSAILHELPLSQVGPDGRPTARSYACPENWAGDQVAQKLGVPQIAFDRPDREDFYRRTRYSERHSKFERLLQKWAKEEEARDPTSPKLRSLAIVKEALAMQEWFWTSPQTLNSQGFDQLMHLKHVSSPQTLLAAAKDSPDYEALAEEWKFLNDEWNERNGIMAESIAKAAKQFPGGRLVVITGGEHRYVLRDLLAGRPGVVIREYWELADIDPRRVPPSPDRKRWEEDCQRLLTASPAVCRRYWQAVINGDSESASQAYPVTRGQKHGGASAPVQIVRIEQSRNPRPDDGTTHTVTPCILKCADGKLREVRMATDIVEGRSTIVAILGHWREISPSEADTDNSSPPRH